jgi:hypothetical protein
VLKILIGHAWRTYVLGEPIEQLALEVELADAGAGVVTDVVDVHGSPDELDEADAVGAPADGPAPAGPGAGGPGPTRVGSARGDAG